MMKRIFLMVGFLFFGVVMISASIIEKSKAQLNSEELTLLLKKEKWSEKDKEQAQRLTMGLLSFKGSKDKDSMLHVAINNNHDELALSLLDRGFPTNIFDCEGCTPLQRALQKGKGEIVKKLLKNKAWIIKGDQTLATNDETKKVICDEIEKKRMARISAMLNSGKLKDTKMLKKGKRV
jgi:hypothetical protein